MVTTVQNNFEFDIEADEEDVAEQLLPGSVAAVVSGTDWTTETIVSQLKRGNIHLNPSFQRRDAWKRDRKSRFIESLIVGLPIPQIVLAESKDERGKFLVLDGKQRLLSILQFWGLGQGENNGYALTALDLRSDLKYKTFADLSTDSALEADYNGLCNQSIRTVVIKNWKDSDFLHTVFLRLNTGSVTLSPQELRQALLPGRFSNYVDDAAAQSPALRNLLSVAGPDPRMRDIEILARFLAFRFFAPDYPGRMKEFLDDTFDRFNKSWNDVRPKIETAVADFEKGVNALIDIFGEDIARKPESHQFNRAIFDALIYFHSQSSVRNATRNRRTPLRSAYKALFHGRSSFLQAVESDTAGAPNTAKRLKIWARTLSEVTGTQIRPPSIPTAGGMPKRSRATKTKPTMKGSKR
jgi:Protein of unknown function DUF262